MFHISALSPLYEAVQSSGLFPDSKFFPDCTLKTAPAEILDAYEQAKNQPGFDLKSFVETHFEAPENPATDYQSGSKPIRAHLDDLWEVLLRKPDETDGDVNVQRSTLLPLPHPYVVPGGRFREVYYWDSYFTMLGLRVSGRADLIQNMVDNFAHQIHTYGHIPNGNRSYYLSRSQPPFFALMVNLLAEIKGEAILLQYRLALEKEYAFWMDGALALTAAATAQQEEIPSLESFRRVVRMGDGSTLNRYWDDEPKPRPEAYAEDMHTAEQSGRPAETTYHHLRAAAESGWDFSSRWLKNEESLSSIQTCDLVPIDLNCLLYYMEKTLVHTYRQLPDHTPVEVFKDLARQRKAAILEHCWNGHAGFFFDYNHVEKAPSEIPTLAAVYPLFFQIADAHQAVKVAEKLEKQFLRPGGLLTTLTRSGQQWDAPNGWAPLQWMAYKGLINYGHTELAEKIRHNWLSVCEKTYAQTGKMMEKYDVEHPDAPGGGGEYPNQDGFGWTNGVYLKMKSRL